MNEIDNKKNEMYMAKAIILRLKPNATYILLTCVEVLHWGNANFSVFRYQHVGIPNVKFRVGVLPNKNPQCEGFCVAVKERL